MAPWAWGFGDYGQLGNDTTDNAPTVPVEVHSQRAWRPVAPHRRHALRHGSGADTAGQAWGWGMDSDGQLCKGNRRAYLTPVAIALPTSRS